MPTCALCSKFCVPRLAWISAIVVHQPRSWVVSPDRLPSSSTLALPASTPPAPHLCLCAGWSSTKPGAAIGGPRCGHVSAIPHAARIGGGVWCCCAALALRPRLPLCALKHAREELNNTLRLASAVQALLLPPPRQLSMQATPSWLLPGTRWRPSSTVSHKDWALQSAVCTAADQ